MTADRRWSAGNREHFATMYTLAHHNVQEKSVVHFWPGLCLPREVTYPETNRWIGEDVPGRMSS